MKRRLTVCKVSNALLVNAPRTTTDKLQRVLNAAASQFIGTRSSTGVWVWRTSSMTNCTGWTFRNTSPSNCARRCISACTAWHHSTSLSFACQSRTSLVAANSALQAKDFYTFLVTTCQTTADARFRTPALTPGTYLLTMCRNRHLQPSSNAL